MQFYIDVAAEDHVTGWVVLENPGDIPVLLIEVPGREAIELRSNVLRLDLKEAGYHATGHAGFWVDHSIVEDFEALSQFSIREKTTGIEIYRRYPSSDYVDKKMFLYIFSILYKMNVLKSLSESFASTYVNVERFPFETTNAILGSQGFNSLACIGRPSYCRYMGALEEHEFFRVALLNDPLFDLAERLILLRLIARSKNRAILEGHLTGFLPLMSFAEQLDFENSRAMRYAFKGLLPEQRSAIANPMVKTFACDIDEVPERRHVGLALEHLASMDLVGTISHVDTFQELFNKLLHSNILTEEHLQPAIKLDGVKELAFKLSKISTVTQLIEHDLALYSYVEDAVKEGVGNSAKSD